MIGQPTVTIAAAVVMTILLALRDQLHGIVRTITWPELRAVLTLLAMTFLLLRGAARSNHRSVGCNQSGGSLIFAILIAAVSFVGYVLVRVTGDRVGIGLAAVTGGLTSSTATTIALARLVRQGPSVRRSWPEAC